MHRELTGLQQERGREKTSGEKQTAERKASDERRRGDGTDDSRERNKNKSKFHCPWTEYTAVLVMWKPTRVYDPV